ncbi:MAG TPA: hypothetical protein VGI40_18350 [Pirellulaceae bacterium]|jgi:hypothetical protein
MLARVRQCRPAVHAALAALVVLALSHCGWQESREFAQRSNTLRQHRLGLPTPIQKPVTDCDHEYGCICRGATLVHAIAVTDWQPQVVGLLPLDFFSLPAGFVEIDSSAGEPTDDQNLPPPLSGRQLRALYASLVI